MYSFIRYNITCIILQIYGSLSSVHSWCTPNVVAADVAVATASIGIGSSTSACLTKASRRYRHLDFVTWTLTLRTRRGGTRRMNNHSVIKLCCPIILCNPKRNRNVYRLVIIDTPRTTLHIISRVVVKTMDWSKRRVLIKVVCANMPSQRGFTVGCCNE
jgi:hypothetical protein